MDLQIAAALKQIGEPFSFELSMCVEPQQYCGRELSFAEPLVVSGQYVFDGKSFSVEGNAVTVLQSVCARCAEAFAEPLAFSFAEHFCKAAEWDEESESYTYEGDRLSLDQAVMDNLYLHLPLTSVCSEDCKGLCPVCGVNRNHADCNCGPIRPRSAWSALDAIRNDEN